MLNLNKLLLDEPIEQENGKDKRNRLALSAIESLDLSNVRMKLQEPEPEGKAWTPAQSLEAEKWYRRFLSICVLYPEHPTVPNGPIDLFWHQHILDTRAYATDCQAVFGFFLHHYPYFGLKGDADVRDGAFVATNELYIAHFGEECTQMVEFHRPEKKKLQMNNCCNGCTCAPDSPAIKAGPCRTDDEHGPVKKQDSTHEERRATACSPPCTSEACGSGCKQCTVDGVVAQAFGERLIRSQATVPSSCDGNGGRGCNRGCRSIQ